MAPTRPASGQTRSNVVRSSVRSVVNSSSVRSMVKTVFKSCQAVTQQGPPTQYASRRAHMVRLGSVMRGRIATRRAQSRNNVRLHRAMTLAKLSGFGLAELSSCLEEIASEMSEVSEVKMMLPSGNEVVVRQEAAGQKGADAVGGGYVAH